MPRSNPAATLRDKGISAGRARQHEVLVVRLDPLLEDVRRLAARAPMGAVSGELRAAAEAMLFEAQPFRGRRRREDLPAAPPTLGALLVVLGQMRAELEAFELAHSYWSGKLKAFAWRVGSGPVAIARLRPVLVDAAGGRDQRAVSELRRKVMRRMEEREQNEYLRGYEDARSGKPSQPERHELREVSGRI